MTKWNPKDLSKLTGVTVQTLHHYDDIGLLKPSVRRPNGYRMYSEGDLLKLQQILALKFFGFELKQIKNLLADNFDTKEHFLAQSRLLAHKAKSLLEASNTLKTIISALDESKSVPWETIIKLIEVYNMTQELEKTWAGEVFNEDELKQYAKFKAEVDPKLKFFENSWEKLINKINANLVADPTSEEGTQIAKEVMDLVNNLYGPNNANLKHSIWEKGYKEGHLENESSMSKEAVAWLDKAIDTYYRNRLYRILNQVGSADSKKLEREWHDIMTEMFGDSKDLRQSLIDVAMTDDKVSEAAKNWLKSLPK